MLFKIVDFMENHPHIISAIVSIITIVILEIIF